MAKTPYLHRRGNNFYFRVTVPSKLRPILGCREIVKTLKTQNHNEAVPLALLLGSKTKRLFNKVRTMTDKNEIDAILELMTLDALDDSRNEDFQRSLAQIAPDVEGLTPVQLARRWRNNLKHTQDKEDLHDQIIEQKLQHLAEIKLQDKHSADKEKAVRDAIAMLSEHLSASAPSASPAPISLISEAIAEYISWYKSEDNAAMLRKIEQQLPMFLEIVGDKPVHELSQTDIINYFSDIQKLPKDWPYKKKKGLSLKNIIVGNEGKEGLAEATVKKSYRAVISGFIETMSVRMTDSRFPLLRTDKGIISYTGNRPTGYGKQRAMVHEELERLFEGEEMRGFATDKSKLHMYWLPHIGLYTGARINEICQLNPQSDILEIEGIWHFKITEDTDSMNKDELVAQSVKNHKERNVPIHSQLIELGFLDYVRGVKKQGHKRLFTAWMPVNGKASAKAADWFQDHLRDIDLRDDTPFSKLAGFHAFRSTFMNHAHNNDIEHYYVLSGHDDKTTSSVIKGYRGQKSLQKLQVMMEKFSFDLDFITPVKPL